MASRRTAAELGETRFDVIVIGGGIYGIMATLEASSRGLKVLLVEAGDWGSGTSYSWLRILHGGLRYLQKLDLPRFYESVRERKWFLEHFPHLVRPISCVMPLYETGSHPPWVMRAALALNDVLSIHRNRRIPESHHLSRGTILAPEDVTQALPYVESAELKGGACWYDAVAEEPQLLLLELLQWCRARGAVCLNYTRATEVMSEAGTVTGLGVRSAEDGRKNEYRAPVVINATGHWAPGIARDFGHAMNAPPGMSWAWNVLFDVPISAASAGAVTAREKGAQTFFVLPWRGRAMVGTGHAAVDAGDESAPVPDRLVARFVSQVARAAPALGLSVDKISRVFGGRLPISSPDPIRLTARPMIIDHGKSGAAGLYSVWGIKYTTALAVARSVIDRACGRGAMRAEGYRPREVEPVELPSGYARPAQAAPADIDAEFLQRIVKLGLASGASHLDDLVLRRCGLGDHSPTARELAVPMAKIMPWSEEHRSRELARFNADAPGVPATASGSSSGDRDSTEQTGRQK